LPVLIPSTAPHSSSSSSSSSIIRAGTIGHIVADVLSGLSLTQPQEAKKKKTKVFRIPLCNCTYYEATLVLLAGSFMAGLGSWRITFDTVSCLTHIWYKPIMKWLGKERTRSWSRYKYYPGMWLERLKNLNQY
jgi:hypothetical protein